MEQFQCQQEVEKIGKLSILLCCGAGVFSGLLARQMHGAAKEQEIVTKVKAKSQDNIADDPPKTDIPLIGPHLSYAFGELKAMRDPYAVPVLMTPKDIHAGLDGKGLLALYMEALKEKG